MIFSDSRYADGVFLKSYDSRRNQTYPTVQRTYKVIDATFSNYVWEEGDRIDVVANKLRTNEPKFWEQILDANPEIDNPYTILPGTIIRIPQIATISGTNV
jgi:phage tail protein X